MHIYFSGIGGTAIGPLALIAKQAGYEVSGSDKLNSQYIEYLRSKGISNIHIGQSLDQINEVNKNSRIDWFVYSSAIAIEQAMSSELEYCKDNDIKTSKRDEFLNHILTEKKLKLIAVAGTHGKTTTTAMTIWLFKRLNLPVSYSVGAKISFGDMGEFDSSSEYFVYEADEFDYNFLAFNPYMSIITGVDWDHHEQYPTRKDYENAFAKFLGQSKLSILWNEDSLKLGMQTSSNCIVLNKNDEHLDKIDLIGKVNRQNAWQVVNTLHEITGKSGDELLNLINQFPGLNRRFEQIKSGLYTDYAHTQAKIAGALQTALEVNENVVIVYEPLTNRRQHYIKEDYKNMFDGVKRLYWVPSYQAREDPTQSELTPEQLINYMGNKNIAEPALLNNSLKENIQKHLKNGDLVLCLSGGGGGSLDEWLRSEFKS